MATCNVADVLKSTRSEMECEHLGLYRRYVDEIPYLGFVCR